MFSILIAHYNNWDYFQECYQSINNQSINAYEIIIVDDFSTDGSYDKLLELSEKDKKIKLFRNLENKKVGFTKRRCIEVASGDICLFVDPDDFLENKCLEDIYNVYQAHPKFIATYSKIKLINTESQEVGVFKFSRTVKNKSKLFFNINLEIAHLFSFKRLAYLQTEGINDQLTSSVDQDLYLKLYEVGNFKFINTIQYFYRLHSKGVSQDQSKKRKLKENWNKVLLATCKRRGIDKLYGEKVDQIDNLSKFIFEKENTFFKKIKKKLSWQQ